MDFNNEAFRATAPSSTVSSDTIDHANMVMACRFGWTAGPANGSQTPATSQLPTVTTPLAASNYQSIKRFMNCRGRLYHQLSCSHRIRTDIVEDCGSNCLEPQDGKSDLPFYCNECVEKEASILWAHREAQHNSSYPPAHEMTNGQYEQWYEEHRQLEAQFANDRKIYELQLKATTRPSNICSSTEVSKDEMDLVAELDSISLAMDEATVSQSQPRANRVSLPNDDSELLHWHLSTLALDRGSCGVEYSANQSGNGGRMGKVMAQDKLWIPRDRT